MDREFKRTIRNKKIRRFSIIAMIIAFAVFSLWKMEIRSVDDLKKWATGKGGEITAYIDINCSTLWENDKAKLVDKGKAHLIPKNGEILKLKKYSVKNGDTAFDLLKKATLEKEIHVDYKYTKAYDSYYVKGINNLYEFDGGKLSGWQYYVNGKYVNYGASSYELKDGDKIYWVYTCNNGKDIKFE